MVCDKEFTEVQVHTEIENMSDVQLTELSLQQQMDIAIQLSMISSSASEEFWCQRIDKRHITRGSYKDGNGAVCV